MVTVDNLQLSFLGCSQASFSWDQPMACDEIDEATTGYSYVVLDDSGTEIRDDVIVDPETTSVEIMDLNPDSAYTFSVRAEVSDGYIAVSNDVSFTTSEAGMSNRLKYILV